MKIIYSLPLIILSFLYLSSCGAKEKRFRSEEGMVWNTQFHITYQAPTDLSDSIRRVLDEVGTSLSVFDPSSLVSRVNASDSMEVNSDFIRVYEMSRQIHSRTGGVFDPTLSPLITAWGFGPGHTPTSDTLRIDSLLGITGIARTRLNGNKIIKERKEIQFNFSAIAKGYGSDRVGEMLSRNGVENYLVEIGGEIAASGKSPRRGDWRISVDRPIFAKDEILHDSQTVVAFTGMGMATSGNYRNFHNDGKRRFGHTISTKTGRPIETDVLSATVLASSAMEADGLATALMAAEKGKAKELAASLRLPVMLIFNDTVWMSPAFERLIVK